MSPEDNAHVNSKRLAKELLLGIEHRGRDATGFAFIDGNGAVQAHKAPLAASAFLKSRRLVMPRRASAAILHTRAATQGSKLVNENNHPIVVANGHMVGVHNGCIWNDDTIFRAIGEDLRIAQVDSEAIFALIAHGGLETPKALSSIEGTAAVAWMTTEDGPETLHLARINSSPLLLGKTENGSLLFGSTRWTIEDAAKNLGLEIAKLQEVTEGTLLTVKAGTVTDVQGFTVPRSYYGGYSNSPWQKNAHGSWERVVGSTKKTSSVATLPRTPGVPAARGTVLATNLATNRHTFLPGMELTCAEHYIPTRLFNPLENVGERDYHEKYEERENAVEDWWEQLHAASIDAEETICNKLHALIRPGDWVTTHFGGRTDVKAQVVTLPQEFPGGRYTLRVVIRNITRKNDNEVECVLVQRHGYEFEQVNPYSFKNSNLNESRDAAVAAICGID